MYYQPSEDSSIDSELSEIERELDQMDFHHLTSSQSAHIKESESSQRRRYQQYTLDQATFQRFGSHGVSDESSRTPPGALQSRVTELEHMMEHLKLQPTAIDTRSQSRSSTPRRLTLTTQETATDDDKLVDLRSENDRLLETLSLVNEKNRALRSEVDSLQVTVADYSQQIELLKATITDLENQRKADQGTIARYLASSIIDGPRPASSDYSPIVPQKAVTPPWATHEDIDVSFPNPKQDVSRTPQDPSPFAAASLTARLESDLLKLNRERQEVESWLGRVPPATATLAEQKEAEDKSRQLDLLERNISEIKAKLRARKLRNSRPVSTIRY